MDAGPGSASKGEKRPAPESGGRSDPSCKRMKTRDLESVFRDEEVESCHLDSATTNNEATVQGALTKNVSVSEGHTSEPEGMNKEDTPSLLDAAVLNLSCEPIKHPSNKIHPIRESSNDLKYVKDVKESTLPKKLEKRQFDLNLSHPSLDSNLDGAPNMLDYNPFYPYKVPGQIKSKEVSECGSCTGPLEDSEPLKLWKTMKQNGFLSSSHGGIPVPKQRGPSRKSKNDAFKKRIELAKREKVNKFAKIAAPSGFLSGLNPGIINHVRNSKQVHSIIEALVRSEKSNSESQQAQADLSRKDGKEINNKAKDFNDPEYVKAAESRLTSEGDSIFVNRMTVQTSSDDRSRSHSLRTVEAGSFEPHYPAHFFRENQKLKMKISSPENVSCMSTEEFSASQDSISSLSFKAATVASQWLELLHQDIRGRLAALKRSKRRVRTMIQTELPSLMLQQSTSDQDNEKSHGDQEMHMARWRTLFTQMEKALSEEGKSLECWLRQVKAMQEHCERGLQFANLPDIELLQQLGSFDKALRSNKEEAFERECALRAAAASIYSTCNLVTTSGNVPCF